jgi:hypothetical protein
VTSGARRGRLPSPTPLRRPARAEPRTEGLLASWAPTLCVHKALAGAMGRSLRSGGRPDCIKCPSNRQAVGNPNFSEAAGGAAWLPIKKATTHGNHLAVRPAAPGRSPAHRLRPARRHLPPRFIAAAAPAPKSGWWCQ